MSQSSCLYDEGEENWPVKLHLGCGGVYLRGYINSDIDGLDALTNPAIVTANSADVSDYYAGLDGDMHHLPVRRMTVVDWQGDIVAPPHLGNTVDKILAIQVFEHLSPVNAAVALRNWRWILRDGRPLVMSVPDMSGVLTMLENLTNAWHDCDIADFAFILRHLRGRNGDGYNTHRAWYTEATLCELLSHHGFEPTMLPNFHFYPALCVRAVKR